MARCLLSLSRQLPPGEVALVRLTRKSPPPGLGCAGIPKHLVKARLGWPQTSLINALAAAAAAAAACAAYHAESGLHPTWCRSGTGAGAYYVPLDSRDVRDYRTKAGATGADSVCAAGQAQGGG
ncbi:hypothetical protein LX36DRAFT_675727 [Colletotrichum falcatum]|nr:hypothetical protein LX36DRAFT_675727 [Colletotrichum falcatum]